jgi:hypothetical protein
MLEASPAMRPHYHKVRSQPLLRGDDQIAGFPNFDSQLSPDPGRYILGTLFEPAARVFNLRIVNVFAGGSLSRTLGDKRIYLHDVQQIKGAAGIHRERRGVRERVN